MSNTSISPTAAAVAATGIAAAMALTLAPSQAQPTITGAAPGVTAVSSTTPAFGGKPLSWLALGANATGAASGPTPFSQVRLTASGVFGAYGAALVQASPDGINWSTLAGMTDAVSNGSVLGEAPGVRVTPISAGVVLSTTDPTSNSLRYLRVAVQNGDNTTSINVTGNLSSNGSV